MRPEQATEAEALVSINAVRDGIESGSPILGLLIESARSDVGALTRANPKKGAELGVILDRLAEESRGLLEKLAIQSETEYAKSLQDARREKARWNRFCEKVLRVLRNARFDPALLIRKVTDEQLGIGGDDDAGAVDEEVRRDPEDAEACRRFIGTFLEKRDRSGTVSFRNAEKAFRAAQKASAGAGHANHEVAQGPRDDAATQLHGAELGFLEILLAVTHDNEEALESFQSRLDEFDESLSWELARYYGLDNL
ncbi:MAG: hypothetical protein Greene041619_861 [Candidatus Peregrinibacteria bacterium Greene0416_19]|nr:MAG: hypothetical protein Greene041619_861 [Candidatus Peregrinibacteria bacterium Greene0416_19]